MATSKSNKTTGSNAKSEAKKSAPKAAKSSPSPKTTMKEEPLVEAADAGPRRALGNAAERGDLFFFYRPDVDEESPRSLMDIRRFHMVLRPEGGELIRLITIGKKVLPNSGPTGGNHWAFVDRVFHDADELKQALSGLDYETETTGERHLPEARPAGEGVYALVRHGRDSVLAYAIELPRGTG